MTRHAPTQSETQIQQQILLAIGARPDCRCWRNNTGVARTDSGRVVRFGTPGAADILCIVAPRGRFVAIEVKSATGRQSEQQRLWGAMVQRMGGVYAVVRSVAEAVAVIDAAAARDRVPAARAPTTPTTAPATGSTP